MFKSSKWGVNKKNAIVSLLLVAALVITGALAFLTAKDSAENEFTVGNVAIDLTEPNWDESNGENIVAGQVIAKDPTITNTGRNDAYVYMMVEIPKVYKTDIVGADGTTVTNEEHYPLFSFAVNKGWTLVDSQTRTETDAYDYYLYAYNTELAPDGVATLFNEVTFANITENFINEVTGEAIVDLDICVTAYAIQSDFYNEEASDAVSAWTLYSNQNAWKWPEKEYKGLVKVNYLNENKESVNVDMVYAGAPVTMYFEPGLAKDGYTFDWVNEATGEVAYSGMTVEEDTDLTATYSETGYGSEVTKGLRYSLYKDDVNGLYAKLLNSGGYDRYSQYENTTVVIPSAITVTKTASSVTSPEGDIFEMSGSIDDIEIGTTFSVPVKAIGISAFIDLNPKNVVIPDSVVMYEPHFASKNETIFTDYLEKIILPYGAAIIPNNAFSYCPILKDVTLPASIKTIESQAFMDCVNLSNINLNYIEIIEDGAFHNCTSLSAVDLSSAKIIEDGAFSIGGPSEYAEAITSINFSNKLEYLGGIALFGNVEKINYTGSFEDWCKTEIKNLPEATVIYINNELISGDIVIPDGITKISNCAFQNCVNITSVTIPESVTVIGDYAFSGCVNLANVNIPDGVTTIGVRTFRNCDSFTEVKIPNSVKEISAQAFYSCDLLKTVYLGKGVINIGGSAFSVKPDNLYYAGTEDEYANINIATTNRLANATKHYECVF